MPFYRMMCIAAHYPEYVCPPWSFFAGGVIPVAADDRLGTETHKGPRNAVRYARPG